MASEKIILVSAETVTVADASSVNIRFSYYPDGRDRTVGRFLAQQYVGYSTDDVDYKWMRIIGRTFDGHSGYDAHQLLRFVQATGGCAYIDSGDCAVTRELEELLRSLKQYTITFVVEGEETEVPVRHGDIPVYPDGIPQKASTEQYVYSFSGWRPNLAPASEDTTYVAKFMPKKREYYILWQDYDNRALASEYVPYGDTPVYKGEKPENRYTPTKVYVFTGWDPAPTAVTGNATYKAVYGQYDRQYTVRWMSEGELLDEELYAFGDMPIYTGSTPVKSPSEKEKYEFSGWDPDVAAVSGDATYTATFTAIPNYVGLTAVYDDSKEVSTDTSLGELALSVFARYGDGSLSGALAYPADYGLQIANPSADEWTPGVDNTVSVIGRGDYEGLSTSFDVTVADSPILLTAEYDDSTPVSKDTPLGDLAVVVKAGYESGKWSDALERSKDYSMVVTAPTAGSLLSGVTNTVTVTGLGIYAGLTTTFYVTATSEEPVDPEEPTLLALQEDDGETTVQIGEENASKLNDALKAVGAGGTVKLKTGNYPLTPGVVTVGWDGQAEIDNVTLDLNGSVLTSTLRKYEKTGLIMLRGKNPTIRGGDSAPVVTDNESAGEGENNLTVTGGGLCGLFDTPDDLNDSRRDFEIDIDGNQAAETGKEYKYWEKESLVGLVPFGYTNATIENLDLHNCWGYGVGERGKGYYNRTLITLADANITVKDEGDPGYYFTSDLISATGAKITDNDTLTSYNKMCVGVAGYFRIVSDENVKYTFTLDNFMTKEISAPPQTMIDIPSNATNVTIKLTFNCAVDDERTELLKRLDYTDTKGVVHRHMVTVFYSREHTGGLNVKGCKMHHNGSLGMVGGSTGETVVENCESWRQGTPYDIPTQADITERGQTGEMVATKGSTIGLIDIEDSPSPSVKMDGCKTRDEALLAMLGAYKAEVSRCSGGTIVIYRGWSANISDSAVDAGVFGNSQTITSSVTTPVTLTNCSKVGSTLVAYPANVTGTGCTIYNRRVDLMPGFATGKNTFVYDTKNAAVGSVTGVLDLTMRHMGNSSGFYSCTAFHPDEGSSVTLEINALPEGLFSNLPGAKGGDCYGVTCNDSFYANGNTVHDSVLKPGSVLHRYPPEYISGTYDNCTIDTSERCLFYSTKHTYGIEVTFSGCDIYNSQNYIFGQNGIFGWGGTDADGNCKFTFKDCKFDKDGFESMIFVPKTDDNGIKTPGTPEVSFENCSVMDDTNK